MVVLAKHWLEPLKDVASLPFVGLAAYDVYGANGDIIELPNGRSMMPSTFCSGTCAMIRRYVHEKIGYFNEDYGHY